MLIRRVHDYDVAALSELICNNAKQTLAPHYTPLQLSTFLSYYDLTHVRQNLQTQILFCAEFDQRIVGSVGLADDRVVGFYTHVDFFGRGIGRMLMLHLHEFARAQGLKRLQLYASPIAVEFYLKMGYQIIAQTKPRYLGVEFNETLMARDFT